MSSIKDLQRRIHDNAVEHGFWQGEVPIGQLITLCHCELSEAFEEYRKGKDITETYYKKDDRGNNKPEGFPTELADCVIRILDMCEAFGIDLENVIEEKHAYNRTRPFKHGKRC